MKTGARIYVPVSVAETRISNRFNSIPTGTLYPNADEIEYLQRLVKYKACLYVFYFFQISWNCEKTYSIIKVLMPLLNHIMNIATLMFDFSPLEMMSC